MTVIFSGDFRQCLPIILEDLPMNELYENCILNSQFANHLILLKLTDNIRLLNSNDSHYLKIIKKNNRMN